MTYHGHVKNGVIVLDDAKAKLVEGAAVVVRPLRRRKRRAKPGSPQAIAEWLRSAPKWHGEPGEMERIYREMQAEKWAQLQEQLKREQQSGDLNGPPAP